jgi:hypothetical protein
LNLPSAALKYRAWKKSSPVSESRSWPVNFWFTKSDVPKVLSRPPLLAAISSPNGT